MPKSKVFKLTSAYIEFLHDRGIAISYPGTEPVTPHDCLDLNLLESAPEQPFQGSFDVEFYPTIYDKAACLFFSIAGGHIFTNGNKRTAVLALDQFLHANAIYLFLPNEDMKRLAENTACYKTRGENHKDVIARISSLIKKNSAPFSTVRITDPKTYGEWHAVKNLIRKANHPGIRPKQAADR
ncbi:MAG: type II toxin-antitoxin system death-on-curing family toxin [Terriglobales bacterium]